MIVVQSCVRKIVFKSRFRQYSKSSPYTRSDPLPLYNTVESQHQKGSLATVQCTLDQFGKLAHSSDSLLTLAASSKYNKKQLLYFVFEV